MKTITLENGTKVSISDESYDNLVNAVQEDPETYKQQDKVLYYLDEDGGIEEYGLWALTIDKPTESYNKETLERALMFIDLQNWADYYNGKINPDHLFTIGEDLRVKRCTGFEGGYIFIARFSSEEIAQKAFDHFGEDFFKKLYNV
jgi:hypothetical protein